MLKHTADFDKKRSRRKDLKLNSADNSGNQRHNHHSPEPKPTGYKQAARIWIFAKLRTKSRKAFRRQLAMRHHLERERNVRLYSNSKAM